MSPDQLRQALCELNGERDATFAVAHMPEQIAYLTVHSAMLVPDEPDHLVKVTDGQSIFIIDAERIAYVRIGLGADALTTHDTNTPTRDRRSRRI